MVVLDRGEVSASFGELDWRLPHLCKQASVIADRVHVLDDHPLLVDGLEEAELVLFA